MNLGLTMQQRSQAAIYLGITYGSLGIFQALLGYLLRIMSKSKDPDSAVVPSAMGFQ